jgi:hypothetical protein
MAPCDFSDESIRLRPLSRVTARAVDWLWPGRLALGKLTILEGDPGLGKSLLCLDLCARLSRGIPFPDGSPVSGSANVLVLSGEDNPEDTVRPRLEALGADLERVFAPDGPGEYQSEPLRFPAHTTFLERALARTGARLLVIDPFISFLPPTVPISSDQSVRQALSPLAQLAGKYACAVILIRHLNKQESSRSLYRGGGSIGLLALCRFSWLVAADPEDSQRRVLAQVKNNLAIAQPSLAFTLLTHEGSAPTLSWLGRCAWTADQLLSRQGRARQQIRRSDFARDFLAASLETGPRSVRDLWALAQEHGLAERTLQRAKQQIGIRSVRAYVKGEQLTYWLLPGQELPPNLGQDAAAEDLEPWLAPLREKYPPATPLDDL